MKSKWASALEPFLLLSKSCHNETAANQLIEQATSSPGVFVFWELFRVPAVAALSAESKSLLKLRLFSHGTMNGKDLSQELALPSEEETNRILEDLVIEAIAFDLIEAKIDQKNQTVKVQWVMSRDLTDLGLEELYQKSCSWRNDIVAALDGLKGMKNGLIRDLLGDLQKSNEMSDAAFDAAFRAMKNQMEQEKSLLFSEKAAKGGVSGMGGVGGSGTSRSSYASHEYRSEYPDSYDMDLELDHPDHLERRT